MYIGGAEFTIGLSKEKNEIDDDSIALKIIVYGMDNMETANEVFEVLSQTLVNLDPELVLAELKGDKSHIN